MNWYEHFGAILIITSLLSACGLNGRLDNEQDIPTSTTVVVTDPEVTVQTTIQTQADPAIAEQATTPPFEPTPPTTAPDDTTPETATSPQQETESAPPDDQPIVFVPDTDAATQQTVNIQLVFDASGSMAEDIGGETKIAAARRAMERMIDQLETDNPNLNVGFRVFGHKGDNTKAGKALSCQSTDLLVPLDSVDTTLLREQTNAWEPTGWTPISLALQQAGEDMQAGENVRNIIIMVTDGEETCEGDPCAVAQALADSDAEVRIDVVGFGLTPDVADTLQCISENSGGVYTDAQTGDVLVEALEELISATIQRSYLRVVAVGPDGQQLGEDHEWQDVIQLIALTDESGNRAPVEEGLISSEGRRTPLMNFGEQRFELPPGTYSFTLQQALGYQNMRAHLPALNTEQTYQAQIVEGQETVAVIGVGALYMTANGGEPEYACDLALEVALDGRWQPVYPAVDGFCSRDDNIVQGEGLAFDREYPILPGRYRVVDVPNNRLLADNFLIEPGKTVRLTIEGLPRAER